MMRCRDLRRLSSRYLEGDLDPERASAARGHLRDCAACQRAIEDEARVAAAARQLPEPPEPEGGWGALWTRIGARVAEEERADASRPRWALWWRAHGLSASALFAAAAAAAAVFVIAPRLDGRGPKIAGDPPTAARNAPDRERFLDRAEREILRADRRYTEAAAELRELVDAERAALSPDRAAALERELAALDERIAATRRRLAVIGIPEPHGRDELYALYREQIALLQRAAVGAPLAAVTPRGGGRAGGDGP